MSVLVYLFFFLFSYLGSVCKDVYDKNELKLVARSQTICFYIFFLAMFLPTTPIYTKV